MNYLSKTRRLPSRPRLELAWFAAAAILLAIGCRGEQDGATRRDASAGGRAARGAVLDPEHPVVQIDTNLGAIAVRLNAVDAPVTVRNFLNLVGDGFYADTLIHYVGAEKMILGGGYSADGRPKPVVAAVRNEAHNGLKNVRGTIAMARDTAAGIDNATSQFFINLADAPSFDHRGDSAGEYGYCVFGEVIEGLDVADRIARSPVRDQGGDLVQTPDPPVIVKSIRVIR
jgi:cyclophilin family peptidyl-prolyl cis-trans isomerase